MTQYEKTKKLFDDLGIGYKETVFNNNIVLQLLEGEKKIDGYAGFGTDFTFKQTGEFIQVVLYE